MRSPARVGAALRVAETAAPQPQRAPAALRGAERSRAGWRSLGDATTMLAVGLFAVCFGLALLHAVLVENQAALDNLHSLNQLRQEQIDRLKAEIAYLDSPEGVAGQAQSAGLVPAPDMAMLTPIGQGLLVPPGIDPFGLAQAGQSSSDPAEDFIVGGWERRRPPARGLLGTGASAG